MMMMLSKQFMIGVGLSLISGLSAGNLLRNGDFSEGSRYWSIGKTATVAQQPDGRGVLRAAAQTGGEKDYAAYQQLVLKQEQPQPLRISGKIAAENAIPGGRFYLVAEFADGSSDWKIPAVVFSPGTYDFRECSLEYIPAKPIAKFHLYVDYRQASGTVKVADVKVEPITLENSDNQLKNPGFRGGGAGWELWHAAPDFSVGRDGSPNSMKISFDQPGRTGMAHQLVELNQQKPEPILISGWSKADNVPVNGKRDYNINVAIYFQDGTEFWQVPYLIFAPGSHDWEYKEVLYTPPRPVKSIRVYCRFGTATGTVWFDDVRVAPVKTEQPAKELAACLFSDKDADGDGVGDLTLENEFIKVVLDPAKGGNCKLFVDKRSNASFAGREADYRLFTDRINELGRTALAGEGFLYRVLSDSPNQVRVEMWLESLPQFPFLAFHKTFTISRHSPVLEVAYTFVNKPAAMSPTVITPYFRSGLSVYGKDTWYFVPTSKGVLRSAASAGADAPFRDVVAGWFAAASVEGNGVACEFDYGRLEYAYGWLGGKDQSTFEFAQLPVRIANGSKYETVCSFLPFTGLTGVDFVENRIAGQFPAEGRECGVTLFSGVSLPCRATMTAFYDDGSRREESRWISLNAGSRSRVEFPALGSEKLKLVKLVLSSDGKPILDAEKSYRDNHTYAAKVVKEKAAEVTPFALNYSREVVTPHRKLAQPYALGPVRALVLVDIEHGREVVELAQRFDLNFNTVRISDADFLMAMGMSERYNRFSATDANRSLAEALKEPYDVIIASGALWRHVNEANAAKIAELCRSGKSGLLLIAPARLPKAVLELSPLTGPGSGQRTVTDWSKAEGAARGTIAWPLLPPGPLNTYPLRPDAETVLTVGQTPLFAVNPAGKPRVGVLAYDANGALTPILPHGVPFPEYDYQEYQFALLGKAMLRLAGKAPQFSVSSAELKDGGIVLAYDNRTGNENFTLKIEQRNLLNGSTVRSELPLKAAEGEASGAYPLPVALQPGCNVVDFAIVQNGKIAEFGAVTQEVAPDVALTAFECSGDLFRSGDSIRGRVAASGVGDVVVRLSDSDGRLLAESRPAADGSFSLVVPEASTRRMFLDCALSFGGKLQDRQRKNLYILKNTPIDDYMVSSGDHRWAFNSKRYLTRPFLQLVRNLGFNTMRYWVSNRPDVFDDYLRSEIDLNFPVASQHLWEFVKKHQKPYNETGDRKYLCRKPCLNDPAYLQRVATDVLATLKQLEKYSPSSFDFGDENSLTLWETKFDFCFSPETLSAFRKWLQAEYPSLNALNRQWDSSFRSWDEVTPMLTSEILEFNKNGRRNYSAWADHRTFMELSFAGFFGHVRKTLRDAGATLPLDISGTQPPNAYNGMDLWLLSKNIDIASIYRSKNVGEILRSFGSLRIAPWSGYGRTGDTVRYEIWLDALNYRGGGSNYYENSNMINPDFTLPQATVDFIDATRDLRNGIGALLAHCEDMEPQVYLHYSQTSVHAHDIEKRLDAYEENRDAWLALAHDLQLGVKFISYEELATGKLDRSRTRVLVLPMSISLSDAEATAIRRFADHGGLVIGDRMTGIMDEHCKLLAAGRLDSLFALARPDQADAGQIQMDSGAGPLRLMVGNAVGIDGAKTLIRKQVGTGEAVFLNFSPSGYNALRRSADKSESTRYRAMVQELLRKYAAPPIQVDAAAEKGCRSFAFRPRGVEDGALFFGIVREAGSAGRAELRVTPPRKSHVYDLRARRYLGELESFPLTLGAADAAFFALLPYKVAGLELTLPPEAKRGADVDYHASVKSSGGKAMLHAMQIEVCRPDGTVYASYGKTAAAVGGVLNGRFHLALNDPVGEWTVHATDAVSGERVSRKMMVK